jgi:thioredoxin-related protein
MSSILSALHETPPEVLTASTIRGSLLFASDPIKAAGSVSKAAVIVAEGVLRAMIRTKLHVAVLVASVAFGLLVPAWLSHARQAVAERPGAKGPAGRKVDERVVNLAGNWILRGYPSGEALGLIRFDGPPRQPRATLLSITMHDFNRFAESKVDRVRIDEKTLRFRFHLHANRPINSRTLEVIAYLPDDQPDTKALWGSMEYAGQAQYPVKLERTDRTDLDRKEGQAPAPWIEDLTRANQTQDAAKYREMLEAMLVKYADTPMAQFAAQSLAINRAYAGASEQEVRGLIDRAARVASRYGHEMEIGQINWIIGAIVGKEELEDVVLDYARRAVAMLEASDPIKLQTAALKNLASALRKARKIDGAKALAEAKALDDRIAALARLDVDEPVGVDRVKPGIGGDNIPWARSYAAARQRAKAESKLLMVDFYTQSCGWCKRLDAEVFPKPMVAEAMRAFVPVKVDAEDGEGGPLVGRYQAHIQGYPAILFLDPSIDDRKDSRIVGKIFGFMPAASFAEQLKTIARLPKDVDKLVAKVHPDDGDAMRLLATALAMQGRAKEAVALIDRARGPGSDPDFDRWAAVYSTLGDEVMQHLKLAKAADWYNKAARVAKRPIDVYNAHLGAGIVATLQRKGDLAARALEAAARVVGISGGERDFAKEQLGMLAKPLDGSAGVPEAVAAMKRLESEGPRKIGDE